MSPSARKDARLVVGGIPRAELLPPELEIEKRARAQRRGLLFIVVLVIGAVGVAYVLTVGAATAVQVQVDAENARTADLLAQQGEYIEVRQLAAQVESAKEAQRQGTSTEIAWVEVMGEIASKAPADAVGISQFAVTTATPLTPFSEPSVPLEQPRIAEVKLVGAAATLGDLTAWLEGLKTMKGFADAQLVDATNAGGIYTYHLTLHLNADLYTNRFAVEEDD